MYWFQEQFIFFPVPVSDNYVYSFDTPTKDVWLECESGKLHGVLFSSSVPSEKLVIYFKGNMGNVGGSEREASIFLELGYDVLVMDYRGSGKSKGLLSEIKLLNDAERWYDWGKSAYGDNVRVVGYSLGTTFASHVAGVKKVAHTILLAPMKSIEDMGIRRYPFIPTFLARYPLRSYEKLKKAAGQIVIYHGTHDKIVPFSSGAALLEVLGTDDSFQKVEGGTHYDLLLRDEVVLDIKSRWM